MFAAATCLSSVALSNAHASAYTGPVLDIRAVTSPQNSANIRVSIEISGTTSCTNSGWYSFELAPGPVESLWSAILVAAISDGAKVTITGTNSCDSYGLEEVSYIDALPPSS